METGDIQIHFSSKARNNRRSCAKKPSFYVPSSSLQTYRPDGQGNLVPDDCLGAKTTAQIIKGPEVPVSRFNPIYYEPTSQSIKSVEQLKQMYPNSFDRLGDLAGEYDIKVDPTVIPVQHARHKIPIEYKEAIETELQKMEEQGIITSQVEPTPWVSSVTYPRKANGKIRICLDPKDLNKAIIRECHKCPTLEEIAHRLSGSAVYTKIDAMKAFMQLHLTKSASLLTTFNTHMGRK